MAPPKPLHCTGAQGPSGAAGQTPPKSNEPSTFMWPMVLPKSPLLTFSFAIWALSFEAALRSATPLVCSVRSHRPHSPPRTLVRPRGKRLARTRHKTGEAESSNCSQNPPSSPSPSPCGRSLSRRRSAPPRQSCAQYGVIAPFTSTHACTRRGMEEMSRISTAPRLLFSHRTAFRTRTRNA